MMAAALSGQLCAAVLLKVAACALHNSMWVQEAEERGRGQRHHMCSCMQSSLPKAPPPVAQLQGCPSTGGNERG